MLLDQSTTTGGCCFASCLTIHQRIGRTNLVRTSYELEHDYNTTMERLACHKQAGSASEQTNQRKDQPTTCFRHAPFLFRCDFRDCEHACHGVPTAVHHLHQTRHNLTTHKAIDRHRRSTCMIRATLNHPRVDDKQWQRRRPRRRRCDA